MKYIHALAVSCLAAGILLAGSGGDGRSGGGVREIRIGTGDMSGVYYIDGARIAFAVNRKTYEHQIHAGIEATRGSVSNIDSVTARRPDRRLHFAIAQSDRVHQAYRGDAVWSEKGARRNLRTLFTMRDEAVTLVATADSKIERIEDLRGKRVNLGDRGSGYLRNSLDVLEAGGIGPEDLEPIYEAPTRAGRLLIEGRLDALFYTVAHPNDNTADIAGAIALRIVPVSGPLADRLREKYPHYGETVIPDSLYPAALNGGDIKTVCVRSTFITSEEESDEVVYEVTRAVFESLEELNGLDPPMRRLEMEEMLRGLLAPVHRGALRYYREEGLDTLISEAGAGP